VAGLDLLVSLELAFAFDLKLSRALLLAGEEEDFCRVKGGIDSIGLPLKAASSALSRAVYRIESGSSHWGTSPYTCLVCRPYVLLLKVFLFGL
jgi:hypothetical protein